MEVYITLPTEFGEWYHIKIIQNICNLIDMKVKIKSHKKWQTSTIIYDISDYNL